VSFDKEHYEREKLVMPVDDAKEVARVPLGEDLRAREER